MKERRKRRTQDEIIASFYAFLLDLWECKQLGVNVDSTLINNLLEKQDVRYKFKLSLLDKSIASNTIPTLKDAEILLNSIRDRARNGMKAFREKLRNEKANNAPATFSETAENKQPSSENLIKSIDTVLLAKELITRGYKVYKPTTQYEEVTL